MLTSLINELKALNGDPEFFKQVAELTGKTFSAVKADEDLNKVTHGMAFDTWNEGLFRVTTGVVSGVVTSLLTKHGG